MGTGAITQNIDVAQLVLYAFWIFFAGLIYYLVRENHREGYPMETDNGVKVTGWPIPDQKTYLLGHGDEVQTPRYDAPESNAGSEPAHRWAGAPRVPVGDPLLAGVGPGSWANRADRPDVNFEGVPKMMPLRAAPDYEVQRGDTDPRGLPVVGADGVVAGKVVDLWVDIAESLFRYAEIELATGGRHVLLPMNFARVRRNEVWVGALLGGQFSNVPSTRQADVVTMLEEEKIQAYYGGGMLYAEPGRAEPLL
jgi:photosynthetic reaction center H subunit